MSDIFVKSEIITNNEGNVKQLQNKYSYVNESIVSKIDWNHNKSFLIVEISKQN